MREPESNLPGSSVEILSASWRDLTEVRKLEQVCFPVDAWPLLDMIGVLTLPNIVRLKAMLAQQMVGFVAADIRASEALAWIATICVHPEHQSQGIGAALLQACERQMNVQRIRLSVRITNQAAQTLYDRAGYVRMDVWKKYYRGGEDAIVMEKVLRK